MDGLDGTVTPEVTSDQSTETTEVTPEAVESYTDIDPNEVPEEGITSEWLQERHKQMQGDYTRKTQEVAGLKSRSEDLDFLDALRSDPDTQRAVMEQLAEMLDGADEDAVIDDTEAHDPIQDRIAALETERAAEKAKALGTEIISHLHALAEDAGLDLDDDDLGQLFERATSGDSIDKSSTENVFKAFHDRQKAQHDKWLKGYVASKQTGTQQVPSGTPGNDAPDMSKSSERIKRMAAILTGG